MNILRDVQKHLFMIIKIKDIDLTSKLGHVDTNNSSSSITFCISIFCPKHRYVGNIKGKNINIEERHDE